MAAPLATGEAGVDIRITDELVSQPYVDMTVRLMERFGVKVGGPRCSSGADSSVGSLQLQATDPACSPGASELCQHGWCDAQHGVPTPSMLIVHNAPRCPRTWTGRGCLRGRWSGGMACSTCTSPPTKLTPRPGRRTSRATHHRRPTSWQVPAALQPRAHRWETRLSRTCASMQPGSRPASAPTGLARALSAGATITGGRVTVEGCGSDSLQGDVRFAEVMGLMGATVEWAPYSITITGAPAPHPGLTRWRASKCPTRCSASCMKACL